jgi:hypothetical protein
MSLYLAKVELLARIHLGKEVAQWLAHVEEADYTIIKWLAVGQTGNQYYVIYNESFDEGDENFGDVGEFTSVDPDADEEAFFDSAEDALKFAIEQHGASIDKFVAGSMIDEEYARYLKTKR